MDMWRAYSEDKDEELKAMLLDTPTWYRVRVLILAAKIHGPVSIREQLKAYNREAAKRARRKKKIEAKAQN